MSHVTNGNETVSTKRYDDMVKRGQWVILLSMIFGVAVGIAAPVPVRIKALFLNEAEVSILLDIIQVRANEADGTYGGYVVMKTEDREKLLDESRTQGHKDADAIWQAKLQETKNSAAKAEK